MSRDFRIVDRKTPMLLPATLDDYVSEDHLARFVVDVVDRLDLGALTSAYAPRGKRAWHPATLLALLFYGYATGVFSSRKLERAARETLPFKYITGGNAPDHDTIAAFRKRFAGELGGLFRQILTIAHEAGLVKLGTVSLDGTKVQANASRHKALGRDYANRLEARLKEEVAELMAMAEAAESEANPELDIPGELKRREDRLAVIDRAKRTIAERAAKRDAEAREEWRRKTAARAAREAETGRKAGGKAPREPEAGPRGRDQMNLTDPESRIMRTSRGFQQSYNAQAVVDVDSHLIVAGHVTDAVNDKRQMAPAVESLDRLAKTLGKPEAVLADSGYHSAANVELCEGRGYTPYIAAGRDAHNRPLRSRLEGPPACPDGADAVERARWRLKTPEGAAVYARRKSTVETVFGVIKETLGFRRFHLRGLSAAGSEWTLVSMAWNLKRMHVLMRA